MSLSKIKVYIRALRFPFVTASALPFIFGSLIERGLFFPLRFFAGLSCVVFTHLGANLINDYADSKYGADWQDKRFWGFFGGSKLIQEGALTESFYFNASLACFAAAFISAGLLAAFLKNISVIGFYLFILFFGFSYSHKPLRLSYRRAGELVIFTLFGPALVMGGYFIQTGLFPALKSFMLSVPFGIFTTAILFSNEVPDYFDDIKSGKKTWVSITGPEKAYTLYGFLGLLGFASIAVNVFAGYLGFISFLAFFAIPFFLKASKILKAGYKDKAKLMNSSVLTINIQTVVSIILIVDILI